MGSTYLNNDNILHIKFHYFIPLFSFSVKHFTIAVYVHIFLVTGLSILILFECSTFKLCVICYDLIDLDSIYLVKYNIWFTDINTTSLGDPKCAHSRPIGLRPLMWLLNFVVQPNDDYFNRMKGNAILLIIRSWIWICTNWIYISAIVNLAH